MPEPHSFPENITLVRDGLRKILGRVSVPCGMADVRSWPHNELKSDIAPCPKRPSRPGEFHPEPLTDPDLTLSRHPARATARRLPPSV